MKNQVVIELSKNDSELVHELSSLNIPFEKCEGKYFDADTLIVTFIITVLPTVITQTTNIITAAIQRNKDIKIKYRGVEMQGLSKEDIFEVLERISSDDHKE